MRWTTIGLTILTMAVTASRAADTPADGIDASKAWTPAVAQAGDDAPLFMTIANRGTASDSLLRIRCPTEIADFTVKHVTDRGEGGTAMREVKTLEIPAAGSLILAPAADHLMLLGVRQPMREGETFTCSLVFKTAGTITVPVQVAASGATTAP